MKRQCCDPYDYTYKIKRGQKTRRKIKVDLDNNQFHKIKNISAREQLLAELAAAEKERKH